MFQMEIYVKKSNLLFP